MITTTGINRYTNPYNTGYEIPNYGQRAANIGGLFGHAYTTGIFGYPYAGYGNTFPSNYTGLEGDGYGVRFRSMQRTSPYPYAGTYDNLKHWGSQAIDISNGGQNGYSKCLYTNQP